MESYEGIAKIYDRLMAGVDYDAWAKYILDTSATFQCRAEAVLDLACGTGNTSIPLARQGCAVTGIDLSLPMLRIAQRKAREEDLAIDFVQKNMLDMDFANEFDLVVSYQDGLNYLVGDGEFDRLAQQVRQALKPKGLFIFDLNQVEKYGAPGGGEDIEIVDEENLYMVYEYRYREEGRIWNIHVTGFIKTGELYEKFSEYHEEKQHDRREVQEILSREGFRVLAVWGIFTKAAPDKDSRRILVVAERTD